MIVRSVVTLVTLLALVLSGAPDAAAQSLHKDERAGFQFKPVPGFKSIALKPNERLRVAKYQDESPIYVGPNAQQRYYHSLELRLYRGGLREDDDDARDLTDRLESHVFDSYGEIDVKRLKKTKVSRAPAAEAEIILPFASPEPIGVYICAVEQDDGVFMFVGETIAKNLSKLKSKFAKAAKSFKRIEKSGLMSEADLAQMSPQERFLAEQIAKLPPDWKSLRTDRYMFLYNAEQDFVEEMSEQIEAMRNEFEKLYPPTDPITAISIVRVCNSVEEYFAYGGPPGSGGYWSPGAKELVFFDMRPREATLAVLRHEAFHQYIYYFYGELSPHSWYNEGHGDYFAGAKVLGNGRIKKYGNAPAGFDRSGTIKEAARLLGQGKSTREGACPPLEDLFRYHQSDYYANSAVCYAAGWAVVHMLRESRKLNDRQEAILPEYLENLLTARHEAAEKIRDQAIAEWEDTEEDDRGQRPPDDVAFYYGFTNTNAVQDRAYELTFSDWSDDDWMDFQEEYIEYVSKI